MTDKEKILESTEYYLQSLISEVAQISIEDNNISTPFQELGIDSFRVLQVIKKLEEEFGTLPKTLLFENFNIGDLSNYFVNKHEQVLIDKFAKVEQAVSTVVNSVKEDLINLKEEVLEIVKSEKQSILKETPILILEQEANKDSELQVLIKKIFNQYKNEGSSSRGTRNIAPNLFIGSKKQGYFNYSRSKNIILVYSYTGPKDYLPVISEEMYHYCVSNNFELNFFTSEEFGSIAGVPFSATPFGILSRVDIKNFTLQGSKMRRLRYLVSKFERTGKCRTEEYHNGSDKEIDKSIASIIDKWCEPRTMVNPLIYMVKEEILTGNLSSEHRLFLTYLDDVLQNVILISKLSLEENGYLMDLEFYPQDMPLGGLEYGIVKIIDILVAEGYSILSLGGTYGCKIASSSNADPELEKTLDYLREKNIFNDEGNLQFKNKFRPEHNTVFLSRPIGSNSDNVTDIIMMIADPVKMQTSDEENHNFNKLEKQGDLTEVKTEIQGVSNENKEFNQVHENLDETKHRIVIEGEERSAILFDYGYNPLNIPNNKVTLDLKTDSWAQLDLPAIQNQLNFLYTQLQQPINVDESLRSVFPFSYFALTNAGRTTEYAFCKSWSKKGIVLQNLLFPTTIFHQIENSFTPKELPHPKVFKLDSEELYKGNLNWEAFTTRVKEDPKSITFVLIEVSNNAAGGAPVSMQHLKDVKKLLSEHNIPLVLDTTRIVENALFIVEHDKEFSKKNVWDVIKEIVSHADAIIASLAKDFGVNKGGLIATNDVELFNKIQDLILEEGIGLDVMDKKIIALSFHNKNKIETSVRNRVQSVHTIWSALKQHGIPVVYPAVGHCVLIDVKQIIEFKSFEYPVSSFVSWLYLNTGIRAGAHNVGMQKGTAINDLVRLAIPVGIKQKQVKEITDRLIEAFKKKINIPEILLDSNSSEAFGNIHSNFKLKKYHNISGQVVSKSFDSDSSTKSKNIEKSDLVNPDNEVKETTISNKAQNDKRHETGDIAIVGIAGRYPKAKNMSEFWDNLMQGKDCIEDIPDTRFDQRLHNKFSERYRGGFIDDVDKFDSLFFNISPREAEYLDPQERLFLEVAWEAIEDAGYYPETLAEDDEPRNIGVYVGAVWTLYQLLGTEEKLKGNYVSPSSHLWGIANRVSYAFNLSGPSLPIDTACSSSLSALYLACEAIYKGECSSAIVGGVNLDVHQSKIDINRSGGALSADGVCRTFGKDANGYVAGEGVGAVFIKPLDKAIENGDNVYGVIKGVAINHGGKTSGFMVPSPKSQAKVIASALENAKVDARSIGYIEAHGTGTELGDPIEISGLTTAFEKYNVDKQECSIGSVKTNIGHLEAAAGIVGLHKVLLQMKHRTLVPSLHSSELNLFIDFKNSPFYVEQAVQEWKPKIVDGVQYPLRAGISSFGAGGANAHVIIEEYRAPVLQQKESPSIFKDQIFPLSARKEDQLRETAIRLQAFLQKNVSEKTPLNIKNIAHTLRIGRKSFDHRLVIFAKTKEELLQKLTLFIEGKKDDALLTGEVKNSEGITRLLSRRQKEEFIKILSKSGDLRKLAQLWSDGLLADWQGIQTLETGVKVSLPTYPFADKRHWISEDSESINVSLQTTSVLHPLIDSNESTFERQVFKKTFHDKDFFIYDHLVSEIPTLPGVAYLDFARKAGELAAGRKVQKIKNILWLSPLTVVNSVPKEVFIELKPNGESVQFEVFSEEANDTKQVYSQGKLFYATDQELSLEPEYIDFKEIKSRCSKITEGKEAYPLFRSLGLDLGPSFQVLQDIYKNEDEILGELLIPEARNNDFKDYLLHPSLIDGSFQAGMAAQLGAQTGEMFVPYSIGEVEVLQPLKQKCFSYVKKVNEPNSKVSKVNVFIVDEDGMILIKIKESIGVPLVSVHEKPDKAEEEEYSKLYYSHEWQESSLEQKQIQQDNLGSILLFGSDDKLCNTYKDRFKESDTIILVQSGDTYEECGNQIYKVNPKSQDDFKKLFETLDKEVIKKICFAWPIDPSLEDGSEYKEDFLNKSLDKGVYSFLTLCQSLIEQKQDNIQLLYLYLGQKDTRQPHNDAINGFIKTLLLEQPKLHCKALEIQQSKKSYDKILDIVLAEFDSGIQGATTIRYEEQERYIRKVKEFSLKEDSTSSNQGLGLKEKGVYIITGGAGGLGLIFAEYLAIQCKARLVLTGRSKLSEERQIKLDQLKEKGAEVVYISADVSKYTEVKSLIKKTKTKFGEINGIIHSAGVLRDSYIRNKTREEMEAVFAPKVYGTHYLDEATKNENLDFFVMFSSLAAVGGNAGQCDYSFANHFMDSFAGNRKFLKQKGKRSGVTLSLNWSLWAEGGMKLDEQTEIFFKKNLGIKPLSTETGLEAFEKGLHTRKTQFIVLEGVQDKIEKTWGIKEKEIPESVSIVDSTSSNSDSQIDQQSDKELFTMVRDVLSDIVMELLKIDPDDISYDKILLDLGFDSIGLTTYANRINEHYKLDVTPVLFFEYPSIKEIALFLSREHKNEVSGIHNISGASVASDTVAVESSPSGNDEKVVFGINKGWNSSTWDQQSKTLSSGKELSAENRFIDQPIAIVGMSGVMPESKDLEKFWENLENERNMITVIPKDRWNWEDYDGDPFKEENKTNSKWGGFMKDVDKFDPLFFGISPREAEMMDPQQRIFLETVWKAIEDSGHKVSDLSGTKTGLFVGVATRDYADSLVDNEIPLDGYTASGNSHSVLVNRVSFLLNLRGPSAPLDTACSSSLIAIHRAIESIHTGSSDMAIVGGVQLMLTPAAYISFGMAGMLSGDGKCKTFDKSANGYVRGEGSGAIFLKPLDKAEADRDHIYAVIKATTENHGGKVTMLTAPNPVAQTDLLVEAYEKAQIDPSTVGYIECHGTGTSLGDPIEIQALNKTFSKLYKRHNKIPSEIPHCGLSSVKTNIGHLETAAGIAGVLKVLLSLKHKKIPGTLHFEELNPYINLKGSSLYIVDKTKEWDAIKDDQGNLLPRRAGVSSFGFGGANSHIVLEEYIPKENQVNVTSKEPQIIVLSAKTEDRLKAYAQLLLEHLEKHEDDFTDLVFTLQVGRDEMTERLGLVVNSKEELKEKLFVYLNDEENIKIKDVFYGRVTQKSSSNFIDSEENNDTPEVFVKKCFANKNYIKLAEAWVKGVEIDWTQLYKQINPRRISLPTYPFARERYWFNLSDSEKTKHEAEFEKLHPLLHYNSSILSQQSYTSNFSGKEFFIADHKIQGQNVMSYSAYLEMARIAVEKSMPDLNRSMFMEFHHTTWSSLFTVSENKQVNIALFENNNEGIDYEIYSAEEGEERIHCSGRVVYKDNLAPAKLDIVQLKTHFEVDPIDVERLYYTLEQMEISYGSSLKSIKTIYKGNDQMLAQLSLSELVVDSYKSYTLHPSIMESTLQVVIGLLTGLDTQVNKPLRPLEIGSLQLLSPCHKEMYVWVRYSKGSKAGDRMLKTDIDLTDEKGRVCIKIKSLTFENTLNNQIVKDFGMLLNTMYEQNSNRIEYADVENSEVSFDELLKDIY
ncbi:SDR family NAD(P)-dependent oxidoreductase [Aquimarina muelleri]|nr:SDR family NAD(P)-dependent oxidoreductase [Aquimarina muelleri]MCX2763650.1 SDR family NAD(P)-dependent oxidoreductase [Aquimarina muelleri]